MSSFAVRVRACLQVIGPTGMCGLGPIHEGSQLITASCPHGVRFVYHCFGPPKAGTGGALGYRKELGPQLLADISRQFVLALKINRTSDHTHDEGRVECRQFAVHQSALVPYPVCMLCRRLSLNLRLGSLDGFLCADTRSVGRRYTSDASANEPGDTGKHSS
ncbi:hypothetical protein ACWDM8_24905 [Streptomyces rubiginosohelvolus]